MNTPIFGPTAKTIFTGVATTLTAAILISVWSVGGFVTAAAYAADQGKLDTIIKLIKNTDKAQTRDRKREALDAAITNAEQRVEELELYIASDPSSPLTSARQANIRRLNNIKLQATRRKEALEASSGSGNSSGGH